MEITVDSPNFLTVSKDLHGTHRFFVQLSDPNSLAEEIPGRASSVNYFIILEDLNGTHRFLVQLSKTNSLAEEKQASAPNTRAHNSAGSIRAPKVDVEYPSLTETHVNIEEAMHPRETNSVVEGERQAHADIGRPVPPSVNRNTNQ